MCISLNRRHNALSLLQQQWSCPGPQMRAYSALPETQMRTCSVTPRNPDASMLCH